MSTFLTETSLQGFFLEELEKVNQKSTIKLRKEALIYSSMVMDRFGQSGEFFELNEGKIQEKVLGTKLLSTDNMNRESQKRVLKDVGDTALCLCGFFSDSLNKKIVDMSYYRDLGKIAYKRLNTIVPDFYDIPAFFELISESLGNIIMMMNLVANNHFSMEQNLAPCLIINDTKRVKAS